MRSLCADVHGVEQVWLTPTEEAREHEWLEAWANRELSVPLVSRLGCGRGERDSPATTDLPITMRLAEHPEPFDWLRSA